MSKSAVALPSNAVGQARWALIPLRDLVSSVRAGVSVNSEDRPHGTDEIGVLKTSAVSGGIFHPDQNKTVIPKERHKVSEPVMGGSILLSRMNTPDLVGESCLVADDWPLLFLPDRLWQLHINPKAVDIRWLAHKLQDWESRTNIQISATGTSGSMKNLSKASLLSMPIACPPLSEQRVIAEVLDTLDDQILATEQIIEKLKIAGDGLTSQLLTRGVDGDGLVRDPSARPNEFVATRIGTLPGDWTITSVGEAFDVQSGITLGPHRRPKKDSSGYLRVANVRRAAIDLTEVARLQASAAERNQYALREYDLLIVEGHADVGQIGRCARVGPDAAGLLHQNHLFRLRSSEISAVFAEAWLNSDYAKSYWRSICSTSSGLNTINSRQLKSMAVGLPSRAEQSRIAAVLTAQRVREDSERRLLGALRGLKQGLMSDLLTGRVRVPAETAS